MEYSRQILDNELKQIIEDCTECGNCVGQCGYLQRFGTPAVLAKQFKSGTLDVETIYSCSLCKLCDVFCPEKLKPSYLFWLMRCRIVEEDRAPLKQHRRILNYERVGLSTLFELYAIPDGSNTIFFPGCALAGSRPEQTQKIFEVLKKSIPDLGIVLSCCAKPSHDLGRTECFDISFLKLFDRLKQAGIAKIITACPSCHQIFTEYGDGVDVKTVYEIFADRKDLPALSSQATVSIHDPCATRFENDLHDSVRKLVSGIGLDLEEMKHRGKRTYCCGEGGSACFVAPNITGLWAEKRSDEATRLPILTYCAGCVQFLGKRMKTIHIIDLVLTPEKALDGDIKTSRSPFTYLNRLRLKRTLKRMFEQMGNK